MIRLTSIDIIKIVFILLIELVTFYKQLFYNKYLKIISLVNLIIIFFGNCFILKKINLYRILLFFLDFF